MANVSIDGSLVSSARIDLRAARLLPRRIVFNKTFSTPGLHTIKVVVAGTRGRPRVDVDAFLLAY